MKQSEVYGRCPSKKEKEAIAIDIVALIKKEGGQFISLPPSSPFDGCWLLVKEVTVIEKTIKALEEHMYDDIEQKMLTSKQPWENHSTLDPSSNPKYSQYPSPISRKRIITLSLSKSISCEDKEFLAVVTKYATRPSLKTFCFELVANE
uniref:DUF6824 domain-containing protein n=1 Tax=Helicotheca tamesis TaxID=374047 RepID=A0A7S2IF27_9STRA|mmetsp:Transcript_8825/g.12200  ORF Transcript_8825/g.12200 Transcript_8825/m.12200 type:complete len:149 (+) Transcript_8825:199-645(+)